MKAGIHPDYRTVLFHDTAADVFFLIGSTADSDRTHTHSDGNTYPYIPLDVSSASHPIYTGQQRKTQVEGRIAGFNKRFASFGSSPKRRMHNPDSAACPTPPFAESAAPPERLCPCPTHC